MNKELLEKAKKASSVEELAAAAGENGIKLTKEKAEEIYSKLHREGELIDDELEDATGGGCSEVLPEGTRYSIGQVVTMKGVYTLPDGREQWCGRCTLGGNKAEIVEFLGYRSTVWVEECYRVRCLGCNSIEKAYVRYIIGV